MSVRVIVCVCVFCLEVLKVNAQAFDAIKTIPQKERASEALAIYKHNYRHTDSVLAFAALAQLSSMAINLQDKPLEIAVYGMKADYYSVNYGFNPHSLRYYQQAIDLSVKYELTVETGTCILNKGLYYTTFKQYVPASQNFLKAYDIFKTAGLDNVPGISKYLSLIADFYYNLGDFETSKRYLLEALSYKSENARQEIYMINTVGMIYRSYNDYENALLYFNKAIRLAQQSKDLVWVGIATGNVGSVYFMQKDYDRALPYLKTDYEQSLKYHEEFNAGIALTRIARINADRNNFKEAERELAIVEKINNLRPEATLTQRIVVYALKAEIGEKTGKPAEALFYRKRYDAAKDSLIKRNNILSVERTRLKWETEKNQQRVNQLNAKARTDTIMRNGLAGVLFLLMIISLLIYNRQKLVNKKDKAIVEKQQVALELETSRADEAQNKAQLALMNYTDKLRQKNDLLESFKAELDEMQRQADPLYKTRLPQLEDMMNAHIMTDKAWQDFKKLFGNVHGNFFSIINNRFQNLTETDLRLMALMKLQLSKREMAGMLGITIDGVKKAKQRLRKKTGLSEDDALDAVIAEI